MNTFAVWLRLQLDTDGHSSYHLSHHLGVPPATTDAWLAGAAVPDTLCCQRLARHLDLPLVDVLEAAGHLPAADPYQPRLPETTRRRLLIATILGQLLACSPDRLARVVDFLESLA